MKMGERKTRKKATRSFKPSTKSSSGPKRTSGRLRAGSKVIARSSHDGFYYPGTVTRVENPRHVNIRFQFQGDEVVPTRFVIQMGGARPSPLLRTGDSILVRVNRLDSEVWVPGIIQFGPANQRSTARFYTVVLYNYKKLSVGSSSVIKIPHARYNFTVRYICALMEPQQSIMRKVPSEEEEDQEGYSSETPQKEDETENEEKPAEKPSEQLSDQDDQNDPSDPVPLPHDEIKLRLQELQEQMSTHHQEHLKTQVDLQEELKQTITLREELNTSKDQLVRQNQELIERHNQLQRQHDKMVRRHRRLQKRHMELKDQHGTLTNQRGEVESRNKELDDKLADYQSKNDVLEGEMESLQQERQALQNQIEANLKKERELSETRQDTQTQTEEEDGVETDRESDVDSKTVAIGDEVLAQSPEEGWFYRGTVESVSEEGDYFVADGQNAIQKVPKKFILTEASDGSKTIKAQDNVVALHPECASQYGPGTVVKVLQDLWYQVSFYDNTLAEVPREEMYFVSPQFHEEITEAILVQEDNMVDHVVVARKDEDGIYYLGTVKERIDRGRMFVIEWTDESEYQQHWRHIFGASSKHRQRVVVGDFVLAVADEAKMIYLPGKVTGNTDNKIVVEFCNKTISKNVDALQSFWLAESYYIEAELFYTRHHPSNLVNSDAAIEPEPGLKSDMESEDTPQPEQSLVDKIAAKFHSSFSSLDGDHEATSEPEPDQKSETESEDASQRIESLMYNLGAQFHSSSSSLDNDEAISQLEPDKNNDTDSEDTAQPKQRLIDN